MTNHNSDKSPEQTTADVVRQILHDESKVIVDKSALQSALVAKSEKTAIFDPTLWDQFKNMSQTFVKSGALPEGTNAEQLMMKMQAGIEMGLKPIESIRALYFIKGILTIQNRDLILQMRRHGWSIKYFDCTSESVSATISRGNESYTDTFKLDDAEKSGWTTMYVHRDKKWVDKPAWRVGANRDLKMRYALMSKIAKTYIPEVLGSASDVYEVAQDALDSYEEVETAQPEKDSPATPDQISTLKKLDVKKIPDDITFNQAKSLLEEIIKK